MKANPDKNLKFHKKRLWGGRADRKASYKAIRHNIKDTLHELTICPDCGCEIDTCPYCGNDELGKRQVRN